MSLTLVVATGVLVVTVGPLSAPPAGMASLRNFTIAIPRAHGHRNIAAALRRNARDAT